MYQKISPEWGCHIDSVKSNPSLSRMKECTMCALCTANCYSAIVAALGLSLLSPNPATSALAATVHNATMQQCTPLKSVKKRVSSSPQARHLLLFLTYQLIICRVIFHRHHHSSVMNQVSILSSVCETPCASNVTDPRTSRRRILIFHCNALRCIVTFWLHSNVSSNDLH